ncbi:MAG: hypothetical protein ACTSRI_22060 [Promethearchaeota archaeon]
MDIKYITEKDFLFGKKIVVGVDHAFEYKKLFYHYGILRDLITERDCIVLETKKGIMEIRIRDIRDIHEDKRSW